MSDTWTEEDDDLLARESRTFDACMDRMRLMIRVMLAKSKESFLRGWESREHP